MRFALLSAILLSGCDAVDKRQMDDMANRIEELEKKNEALAAKVETLGKAGPMRAAPTAAPVDSPEEKAATALMQAVQQAQAAGNYDLAKAKLKELQDNYATTRAGKASARIASEINLVGSAAPEFTVEKWYQGKADYSGAKTTVLVFWESWCPHCKEEMPKMQPFAEKWKPKGVQVIGLTKVTKTSTDDAVSTFLKDNAIKFPVAKEMGGSLSTGFSVSGIPAAAIVRDGKVIWRGHPARLNDDLMNTLVGS